MPEQHTAYRTPHTAHAAAHFGRLNARGGSFFGIYPPPTVLIIR